jgi:hypothetical protein
VHPHPGPPKGSRKAHPRPARQGDVALIPLVGSAALQKARSARDLFYAWLIGQGISLTLPTLASCPSILGPLCRCFGRVCFAQGTPLYLFRHLLTSLQSEFPHLRHRLGEGWDLVTRWQIAEPLSHRAPLPEPLCRAMCAIGFARGWERWAGCLLLAFEGILRIGEVLRATRSDLVLPSDLASSLNSAFLRVRKPKTAFRGGARTQHARVRGASVVSVLSKVFGHLDPQEPLFPGTAYIFRRRWDAVLLALDVPTSVRLTPGGVRGGGAVAAYHRDIPIADILWAMRLKHTTTLEHYLQEVAALNVLAAMPADAREAVAALSRIFGTSCV